MGSSTGFWSIDKGQVALGLVHGKRVGSTGFWSTEKGLVPRGFGPQKRVGSTGFWSTEKRVRGSPDISGQEFWVDVNPLCDHVQHLASSDFWGGEWSKIN